MHFQLSNLGTLLLLASLPLGTPSPTADASHAPAQEAASDEPKAIEVGNRIVKGKKLKLYDSKWSSSNLAEARITETSSFERAGSRRLYVRKQVFPMQPGLALHSTLALDAKTLQTVSFQQEIVGLPPGAGIGSTPVFSRWDFEGSKFKRTYRIGEETTEDEGAQETAMFEGSALGLVIAALPLKDGYRARLPVSMSINLSTELTRYWVDLSVVGKEPFEDAKGRTLEAWVVNVDWLDYESKALTSKGGYDQPGGAYFVVPKPPKGFPHVPRYANNAGVIELDLN